MSENQTSESLTVEAVTAPQPARPIGKASLGLYAIFVAAICIVAILSALAITARYGVGLSPDSVGYVKLARHLSGSGTSPSLSSEPIGVEQPLLFPITLSIVQRLTGVDPIVAVRYINAAWFVAIIVLSAALLRHNLKACGYLSYVGVTLVLAGPLLDLSMMAWTEPMFIAWTLVFLLLIERYRRDQRMRELLLCSVVAILACFTRYIGVTLIGAGVLLIPALTRADLRRRLTRAAIFAGSTASVVGLYAARNLQCSGTPFGPRYASQFTLNDNITFAVRTILTWFCECNLTTVIVTAGMVGSILTIGYQKALRAHRSGRLNLAAHPWLPILTFALVYVGFLILTSTTTAYDRIDNRLLAPAYVPVVLLVLLLVEVVSIPLQRHLSGSTYVVVPVFWTCLLLMVPMQQLTPRANLWQAQGRGGYSTIRWHGSKLMKYLAQHALPEPERPVYSNKPHAIYALLGKEVQASPRKLKARNSAETACELSQLPQQYIHFEGAYLIWFHGQDNPSLFTKEELSAAFALHCIRTFPDGAIYQVGAGPLPLAHDEDLTQIQLARTEH